MPERVELPVAALALAEEGLARVGQIGRDDGVLVLCGLRLGRREHDDEEVALEVLHLLLRLLDHLLGVHAHERRLVDVVLLRVETEERGHRDLPLVAVEERDLGDRLDLRDDYNVRYGNSAVRHLGEMGAVGEKKKNHTCEKRSCIVP